MRTEQQIQQLVDSAPSVFRNLKTNYMEFLQSLKYENISDKKNKRSRGEEVGTQENWREIVEKQFSFEDEIITQHAGLHHFNMMVDNIRKLEEINSQLLVIFSVKEGINAGEDQLRQAKQMMEHLQGKLIMSLGGTVSKQPKREFK